jgi:hypothetical protein
MDRRYSLVSGRGTLLKRWVGAYTPSVRAELEKTLGIALLEVAIPEPKMWRK